MATITLHPTEPSYQVGWMGICPETGPINLREEPLRSSLIKVLKVDEFSTSTHFFNPLATGFFDNMQEFGTLDEGSSYIVILKSQADAGATTVSLPGFVPSKHQDAPKGNIVETCEPAQDCTATAELITNNTELKLTLDFSTMDATGTDGNIKALEVVFDNVVFADKATTDAARIASGDPVVTADWGGQSGSDLDGFKEWGGTFLDLAVRRNGTLPNYDADGNPLFATFGFIDLYLPGITYSSYSDKKFEFIIPVATAPTDPIEISEVRVYDSSVEQNMYGVTLC